jgi:predicted house-cleaning noncanonical NTP pyrophosphatase (MazG superfamily)
MSVERNGEGMGGKLVRDRIPEIIRASGIEPVVYRANSAEYRQRLREKLHEESLEVLHAPDAASVIDELADVWEVLLALAADLGLDEQSLRLAAARKVNARGAFESRLVWMGNEPEPPGSQ